MADDRRLRPHFREGASRGPRPTDRGGQVGRQRYAEETGSGFSPKLHRIVSLFRSEYRSIARRRRHARPSAQRLRRLEARRHHSANEELNNTCTLKMGKLGFLGGVLFCASSGVHLAFSSETTKTYNLPGGTTVHVTTTTVPAAPAVQTHFGPSMVFSSSFGYSGGFPVTQSTQLQGDQVEKPITPEAAQGGTGYTQGSYERPFSKVFGPPRPTRQILYGWIPDVDQQRSLQELNNQELREALMNHKFVNKLRSKAIAEMSCTYALATERQSYLEAFWQTVSAERRFRKEAEKSRAAIEAELHRDKMAGEHMSYRKAEAVKTQMEEALQKGKKGKDEVSSGPAAAEALRYKETVDRLMGVRLEILLSCKLAALLGQPQIFLNPNVSELEALDMVATALGVGASTPKEGPASPTFGGLEPFLMASNPLILGHLMTLLIGYIDKDLFFKESARKPFYSFTTLVGATGGETAISMLDEMCDRDRGPHYKTSLFKKNRPKDRNGKPRVRGSNRPWYIRGGRRVHNNSQQPELLRVYCDATEMLLNAMMLKQEDIQQEMQKFSLPVEPLVDAATNAARIQTRSCRGESPVCSFDNTILNPTTSPLDPEAKEQNTQTRTAFDLYTGIASAQLGNLLEASPSQYADVNANQWVDMLSKPAAHSDIMEKVFFFDTREMIAKRKSKVVKQFESYAQRVEKLKGKKNLSFEEAASIYSSIQSQVMGKMTKGWKGNKAKISMKNLFRIASVLLLKSTQSCDMKSSFAERFESFSQFMFSSREGSGQRQPASQRSLMAFFRTGKAPALHSMCSYDPLTINYMFLYRFILLGDDAARTHDRQHAAVSKTRLSTRILGSKWTPSILKTVMRGFRRKTMVKRAKELLLESLDPSVLPAIISSFDWIVHTQATLQVNQNSEMYHDLGVAPQVYQTSAEKKETFKLSGGGLVKSTDKQLEEWSEYGIPASLTNKLRKGEKLPKSLAFERMPTPELTRWEAQLNTKWLTALTAYLEHPYGRAALAARDPIAMLIQESRNRLEADLDSTIFLGRIVKAPRVSKFKRALNAVGNFFRSLIRAPQQSEYAVWMGVKVNVDRVLYVMKAVNNAAEIVKSTGVYDHVKEGFLDIVKDVIMGNLDSHHRIVGYDTYAAIDEQMRKEGLAAATKRNHGFLAIHHDFPNLSEAERHREFQLSMCMDHCEALWKLIVSLVLTNMQNPQKLGDYEKEMSKTKAIASLSDPNRVNAFRLGLNVQTDYFDNLLDKGSKENIKRMKYGGGTWFAYSLLLAGRINTAMGMPNLGTTLAFQAPYYGNFILRWLKERREARKKAIMSMLTLGFFFAYTFLSVTDITQHLTDSGLGPAVDCLENLVVGPICPAEVVAPAISSAAKAAAQDVFKVGVFGLLTPYLVWPMMLISVWQILKSEFKVLLQFEMSVKSLFTRIGRWAKRPFKEWWNRRRRMKEGIMKSASDKYRDEKTKNKGKAPQARDFVGRTDTGAAGLDSLGVPSAQQEISFDITVGGPVFPHSPPLARIRTSSGV
ncbi:hypothetical protein Efla_004280 [Eimeria flavescens]